MSRDQLKLSGFGALTETVFNFAKSLKLMNVDETEFAMLGAICITSGGGFC